MENSIDVLDKATAWLSAGKEVAIATVIGTWGSSPRPVGSQLAVDNDGGFIGSVSGGCIEGEVIGEAVNTIKDKKVRLLEFGVTNEQAWEVGLACGGNIKIFIEKVTNIDLLQRIRNERPLATVTNITDGKRSIVSEGVSEGELTLSEKVLGDVSVAVRDDKSQLFKMDDQEYFLHVLNNPIRMLIIGAVHISQALVPMAQAANFEVSVIDPRGSFATVSRFPNVTLIDDWPDDAMDKLNLDNQTAVVTLTHDPKLDDPALKRALESKAFYIGALGSKRTHASRLERLSEYNFSKVDIARINAPIGLDLGAISPAEIAVSIMAQVIATKHDKLSSP